MKVGAFCRAAKTGILAISIFQGQAGIQLPLLATSLVGGLFPLLRDRLQQTM